MRGTNKVERIGFGLSVASVLTWIAPRDDFLSGLTAFAVCLFLGWYAYRLYPPMDG